MERNQALAERVILGHLQRGHASFDELLSRCASLFPDELNTTLDNLVDRGQVRRINGAFAIGEGIVNPWTGFATDWSENLDVAQATLARIMELIHLPHALDYEWWFSHSSRESLARTMLWEGELTLPETTVFLGSPIFGAFVSRLAPNQTVYILDKSQSSLDAIAAVIESSNLHLVRYDASEPLPEHLVGIADMVFFDPPWYPDYYDLFFKRSALLCKGRVATVGAVIFPLLTRPNSAIERRDVMAAAMGYGFSPTRLVQRAAEYLTPPFEREALERQGIQAKNWRRGDLAVFFGDGIGTFGNERVRVEPHNWAEVLVGKIKVKVRQIPDEGTVYAPPSITPIQTEYGQLATVSRRDPIRGQIGLWTSTHVGYQASGWRALVHILEGIRDQKDLSDIVALMLTGANAPEFESVYTQVKGVYETLSDVLKER